MHHAGRVSTVTCILSSEHQQNSKQHTSRHACTSSRVSYCFARFVVRKKNTYLVEQDQQQRQPQQKQEAAAATAAAAAGGAKAELASEHLLLYSSATYCRHSHIPSA